VRERSLRAAASSATAPAAGPGADTHATRGAPFPRTTPFHGAQDAAKEDTSASDAAASDGVASALGSHRVSAAGGHATRRTSVLVDAAAPVQSPPMNGRRASPLPDGAPRSSSSATAAAGDLMASAVLSSSLRGGGGSIAGPATHYSSRAASTTTGRPQRWPPTATRSPHGSGVVDASPSHSSGVVAVSRALSVERRRSIVALEAAISHATGLEGGSSSGGGSVTIAPPPTSSSPSTLVRLGERTIGTRVDGSTVHTRPPPQQQRPQQRAADGLARAGSPALAHADPALTTASIGSLPSWCISEASRELSGSGGGGGDGRRQVKRELRALNPVGY
jgi:hypothetical protein